MATAVACAGCTTAPPALIVGGSGIRACLTNPRSRVYAVIVPVQNFSTSDVVIDSITPSGLSGATFVEARVLSRRSDGSEPTLPYAGVGFITDIAGYDDAVDVAGTVLEAGAQVKVAVAVQPTDASSVIAGVTANFGSDVARSTVVVWAEQDTCE